MNRKRSKGIWLAALAANGLAILLLSTEAMAAQSRVEIEQAEIGLLSLGARGTDWDQQDGKDSWSGGAEARLPPLHYVAFKGSADYHREKFIGGNGQTGLMPTGGAESSRIWLLTIVLLNGVPGFEKITVLHTFDTSQECQIERDRVGYEMAEAYPFDRDFIIACQLDRGHNL